MSKRHRSDTAAEATRRMADALTGPAQPPAHVKLRETDWPFWFSIVSARAKDSWNDADLEMAANLARTKSDIDRLGQEIDVEGDVVKNDRGTQIMNPKHSLLETLSRRAVALSRMLHVHAEATQGRARDTGKRGKAEQETQAALQQVEGDNLLARPVVQ